MNIQKEIESYEKKIEELKSISKEKTIKIKELKIEVETEIHNKNQTLAEAIKDCPKGWRLLTYNEIQWLRNSKYINKLNLLYTWEFIENPDKISKKRKKNIGQQNKNPMDVVKDVEVAEGAKSADNINLNKHGIKRISDEILTD